MVKAKERIGTVLGGKYRIDVFIQRGGMSTVYQGTDLELERRIAIKIFHPYLGEDENLVARFLNEALGTSRLSHENIVNIFDLGKDEKGIPFFVMEYLEGRSLKARLEKDPGWLSIKESAGIMIQVLSGLNAAHSRGITHRDLKPGNIFISKAGDGREVVKILDFGIARFREMESEGKKKLTATGTVLGTPEFMSVEQARAQRDEIDHRSDLYSCGVILYRCLTGISPMKGSTQFETLRNVNRKEVSPPSEFRDSIPPEVDQVVLKAMSRDKQGRYQDCGSFIEAMKVFYCSETETAEYVSSQEVRISQELTVKLPGDDKDKE